MDSKLKNLKNASRPSSSASESKTTTVVVSSTKGNVSKTAVPVAKVISKVAAAAPAPAPAPVVVAAVPVKAVRGGAKTVPAVVAKAVKGGAKAVEPVLAVKSKEVTKAVATKAVAAVAAVAVVAAKAAPVKVEAAKVVPAKATKAAKVVAAKVEVTKKGGAVKTAVAKNEKVAATPVQQRKKVAAQVVKAEEVTKAKKTVEKVQETADDIEEQTNGKLRYFKLFYNDEICGRYCGKKPKQAANKAFSSIIKDLKKSGNETAVEIAFSIKECTRNSKHKEYKYIGQRQVLKEPVKVEIQNNDGTIKEIIYKYHNLLSKAPK